MRHINVVRTILLLLIIIAVCAVAYSDFRFEQISCMEIRVLSSENQIGIAEKLDKDLSGCFYFKNEPAAVDRESRTIYISQNIADSTRYQDLEGKLSLVYRDFQLYFAPDPCFQDLKSAVAEGHRFRLLAVDPQGDYIEYHVVFTTLPVLNMTQKSSDGEGYSIRGTICLWSPDDPDQLRYSVKTSSAEWHVRGATSAGRPKKPLRLSLKTKEGAKTGLSLLGLGNDDDWILNPMNVDDIHLREPLFMHLWNEMAIDTSYNYPMSSSDYIEVVINREYQGIFFLQRRVDSKYLELPADSILLKGKNNNKMGSIHENYEIVASPFNDADTYALLHDLWEGDCTSLNFENFVDINLFLHFFSAVDNGLYKNMIYVLDSAPSGYTVTLVPWDTDMSFGTVWTTDFAYDYKKSIDTTVRRMEYDAMLELHPDLNDRMAARWQELRKTVLSEENILSHLIQLETQLAESGVTGRDRQRWGEYYGGSDTIDNLYRFIREKLPLMDAFYAQ